MVDLLRHLFLPHHTNNHRARALHIDALFVYVLAFTLFNIGLRSLHRQFPDILGFATNIAVDQLLSSTNAKRAENGLSPLSLNSELSQAAAGKASDMFANNYWAHVSPQGRTPWEFILGAGYNYSVAGENLAKNFQDSQGVVEAWMASPTHKENILKSNYQEVGYAVVNGVLNGEETTLVVQMFGSRSGSQVAKAKPAAPAAKVVASEPAPATSPEVTPEPSVTAEPTLEPTPVEEEPSPTEHPVEVSAVASSVTNSGSGGFPSAFLSASRNPLINIPLLTREVTLVFVGIITGLMAIDAWHVARRRVVRAVGHTIGHILFLGALLLTMGSVLPGSIL